MTSIGSPQFGASGNGPFDALPPALRDDLVGRISAGLGGKSPQDILDLSPGRENRPAKPGLLDRLRAAFTKPFS